MIAALVVNSDSAAVVIQGQLYSVACEHLFEINECTDNQGDS